MLPSSLTLNTSDGTDAVFDEKTPPKGITGRYRVRAGSTFSDLTSLRVDHTVSGVGNTAVDRHLSSVTITRYGADGKPKQLVVNLTAAVSRDPVFDDDDVKDAVAFQVSLWSTNGFSASTGFAADTYADEIMSGGS